MKTKYILIVPLFSLILGCKKENEVTTPPPVNPPQVYDTFNINDYVKLDSGNFWVYEIHRTDSNGIDSLMGIDTARVTGNVQINGYNYHEVIHYFLSATALYYRDSANCIINPGGDILLSTNFNDTIGYGNFSGIYESYSISLNLPSIVTVPAGVFDSVLTTRIDYYFVPPLDTSYNPRQYYTHFAKNIGLIKFTYSYGAQPFNIYDKRLVSYFVQ
ncbi:MAG: hypothetical protein ACHQNT_08850 [Bacteroidia bacterium]